MDVMRSCSRADGPVNGVRTLSSLLKAAGEQDDAVPVAVPPVPSTPRALSPEGRTAALADLLRQATQASLDPDAVLEVAVRWCVRVLGDRAGGVDARPRPRDA